MFIFAASPENRLRTETPALFRELIFSLDIAGRTVTRRRAGISAFPLDALEFATAASKAPRALSAFEVAIFHFCSALVRDERLRRYPGCQGQNEIFGGPSGNGQQPSPCLSGCQVNLTKVSKQNRNVPLLTKIEMSLFFVFWFWPFFLVSLVTGTFCSRRSW